MLTVENAFKRHSRKQSLLFAIYFFPQHTKKIYACRYIYIRTHILNGYNLIMFTVLIISFNTKSRPGCERTVCGGVLKFSELSVAMPFFTSSTAGIP